MRPQIKVILGGVCLAAMLTGCASIAVCPQQDPAVSASLSQSEEEAGIQFVYRQVQLPESYFITYEIYDTDNETRTITKAVDAQGNIYYEDGQQYLFLPQEEGYALYEKEEEAFVRQSDEFYSVSYMESFTEVFHEYLETSVVTTGGNPELIGQEMIAHRDCDVYSAVIQLANYAQTYQYALDQETGACLRLEKEETISGFVENKREGFVCIQFDTQPMDLREAFLEENEI